MSGARIDRELVFLCKSPSIVMTQMNKVTRSIIMTRLLLSCNSSGTLSPLTPFSKEFDIPFQNMTTTSHIINKDQLLVLGVKKGPSKQVLIGTHDKMQFTSQFKSKDKADSLSYWNDIGLSVIDLLKAVPNGLQGFINDRWFVVFPKLEHSKQCHCCLDRVDDPRQDTKP